MPQNDQVQGFENRFLTHVDDTWAQIIKHTWGYEGPGGVKQTERIAWRQEFQETCQYIYIYNFQYIDINLSRIYLLDSGGVLLKKSKNTMGFPANFPLERIHWSQHLRGWGALLRSFTAGWNWKSWLQDTAWRRSVGSLGLLLGNKNAGLTIK